MKRTLLALAFFVALAVPVAADSPTMSVTFIDVGQGAGLVSYLTSRGVAGESPHR